MPNGGIHKLCLACYYTIKDRVPFDVTRPLADNSLYGWDGAVSLPRVGSKLQDLIGRCLIPDLDNSVLI